MYLFEDIGRMLYGDKGREWLRRCKRRIIKLLESLEERKKDYFFYIFKGIVFWWYFNFKFLENRL